MQCLSAVGCRHNGIVVLEMRRQEMKHVFVVVHNQHDGQHLGLRGRIMLFGDNVFG